MDYNVYKYCKCGTDYNRILWFLCFSVRVRRIDLEASISDGELTRDTEGAEPMVVPVLFARISSVFLLTRALCLSGNYPKKQGGAAKVATDNTSLAQRDGDRRQPEAGSDQIFDLDTPCFFHEKYPPRQCQV